MANHKLTTEQKHNLRRWAQDHDWCRRLYYGKTTKGQDVIILESTFEGILVFQSVDTLRRWAGY